ncbi:hypothetical protein [Streptomyces justiciae]|uniref:Uncharacterized protein n=1 Tax=Streptomyces justiciae TaxID=2780140 RepID=A0ABU3M9E8_9ACTN|nr:hypothetical protein [Streptomyces justiciae]MDT7847781.1 hypothetical protein [Streptomyces justiciae]
MAGRAVPLIPLRGYAADEGGLPGDCRKILGIVREADGPVQVWAVGERQGLDASAHGKLEPLRAKMIKLAVRGGLHKRGNGRFAARPWARGAGPRRQWGSPSCWSINGR